MTRTAEQRAALSEAKARIREILRPEREAKRIAAAKARKDRDAAMEAVQGQRQSRVREPLYLAWVRRLPCAVADHECSGPIEAAHLRFSDASLGRINPGLQCKPSDKWATPLCRFHHQHDQHKRRERDFWAERGIEPGALCIALHAAFLSGEDGSVVLQSRGFDRRGS